VVCKRCGSACPERETGYCLHCQLAVGLRLGKPDSPEIVDDLRGKVFEGYPDWEKPVNKENEGE